MEIGSDEGKSTSLFEVSRAQGMDRENPSEQSFGPSRTDVEKGSMRTAFDHGWSDPKAQINFVNEAIGRSNIRLSRLSSRVERVKG